MLLLGPMALFRICAWPLPPPGGVGPGVFRVPAELSLPHAHGGGLCRSAPDRDGTMDRSGPSRRGGQ